MKKILLLLLFTSAMFAQELKQVPKQILSLQSQNKKFTEISLFAVNQNYDHKKFDSEVNEATVATLDQNALNTVVSQKPDYLQFSVPYNNESIDIVLYKVQIQAADFRVDTDKGQNIAVEKGVHYRGIVNGNINSIVSFNFFKGDVNGIISGSEFNNLNIGKLTVAGNTNDYIIYSDLNLKKPFSFICDVKDTSAANSQTDENVILGTQSTNCVAIYFELDYKAYTQHGSNLNTTLNWFNSIFNNVQTLYANDGITTAIKSVFVWTSIDPYFGGQNSTDYLNEFVSYRPVFNGDIAQLVSYEGGGYGGLAYLNGLCGSSKHGYSDIQSTFATVPQYSWTVEVISHELGHQMGSQHTHACAWNGNNTSIDGCAPTYNPIYAEGNCPTGPVPASSVRGTIMSYCHLLSNVGINFANGFGPQPAARILGKVNAATCLSTDCINTCISTVSSILVQNLTETGATVTWTDANASAGSWQVAAASYPYTSAVWTTVNSPSYIFTTLQPGTYYKFMVRPICNAPLVADGKFKFEATKVSSFCSGISFTDTGLVASNYNDNEEWTRTFTPPAGSTAKVVFNTLNLEIDYDYLYVYNGPTTSSPMFGSLTGSYTNLTFEATNPTGELTFRFYSDGAVNEAGWNATINCISLGINNFAKAGFSYYPNPVKDELILNSKTEVEKVQIYSIDGRLVFEQKNTFNEAKINTAAFAKGTYIVRVAFAEGSTGAFKIMKQ